jgi:hypothetical protein
MPNVVIDVTTTVDTSVVNVQEVVYNPVIKVESTINTSTVDVSTTVNNSVVEVNPPAAREVTINVETNVVPLASPTVVGKMKLYTSLGVNTDGSVDQNTVNSSLALKVDKVVGKSLVLDTDIAKIPNLALKTYVDSQDTLKVDKVVGKSLVLDTEITRLSKLSGGQTEIDFGAISVYEKKFTIADANVLSTSIITASIAYEAPTGKDLDEIGLEKLQIICGQSVSGSFDMLVSTINCTTVSGSFKINYLIS